MKLPKAIRNRTGVTGMFYLLVALAAGLPCLWPGTSFFRWDTLVYTWPLTLETRAQWLSGHWPFWASAFCCGTPLLANINAGVLYPLRLPLWVLPLEAGTVVFILVHVWLSLWGMHVFLRRGCRLPTAAAAIGAIAYALGGYARAMWDTYNITALPWIPLGLCAVLAAGRVSAPLPVTGASSRRGGVALARPILAAALCWGLIVLGGDIQAAVVWVPVALLLAISLPGRRRALSVVVLSLALGLLLTAVQWLPTAFAHLDSYRATGMPYTEAIERSLHPLRLFEFLVPHAWGRRDHWFGPALGFEGVAEKLPWAASIHIGILAFGLVLLGASRRGRMRGWAVGVAVGSLLLALGGFLPGFRYWQSLPLFGGFRYPEKYVLWTGLGLAVLAARGAQVLLAIARRNCRRAIILTVAWLAIAAAATLVAQALAANLSAPAAGVGRWYGTRWLILAIAAVGGVLAVALQGRRRVGLALSVVVLLEAGLHWDVEKPLTRSVRPLTPPLVAHAIQGQEVPYGRYLLDPAVTGTPLDQGVQGLRSDERRTVYERALMMHNMPRLWGMPTPAGFSPLESGAMRAYRLRDAEPTLRDAPPIEAFARYCRTTAVRWLLTTPERADALFEMGIASHTVSAWGPAGQTVLLQIRDAAEAGVRANAGSEAAAPAVLRVHRFRPGRLRVDLAPGDAATLIVSETFARGWQAVDGDGTVLPVDAAPTGLMRVVLPAGVSQVRLRYIPAGWLPGLVLSGLGLLLGVLLLGSARIRSVGTTPPQARFRKVAPAAWQRTAVATGLCAAVFIVLGVGARNHWACTYDEGFHVARGLARVCLGDSRLSYFHPPLQNGLEGLAARTAFAGELRVPTDRGWEAADIWRFAVRLAEHNAGIYPELVRAARWGSTFLGVLAIAACAWWARQGGGALAAWLAALGLALNPSILAHGNLATTDMGVAAFAMVGAACTWRFAGGGRTAWLSLATLAYVFAALTKHSGLIWLLAHLALAVPLLAASRRSARVLWQVPLGILAFAALLLLLYGTAPQEVRGADGWWAGRMMPAGRYWEGLVSQGHHAVAGHRAFFGGKMIMRAPWWYVPAAVALKSPPLWVAAAVFAAGAAAAGVWRRRRLSLPHVAALLPAVIFVLLLVFASKLALGVRHALPLVMLGTVAAAAGCARLVNRRLRLAAAAALVVGSAAAATVYPNYLSYYPLWAGGVAGGQRWMVDSNYDWGQDLEILEQHWAAVVDASGGRPPKLLYFGFVDPERLYAMPVGERSYCGFMGRVAAVEGGQSLEAWAASCADTRGPVVASVSALALDPFGMDLSGLRAAPDVGRIGPSFRVKLVPAAPPAP